MLFALVLSGCGGGEAAPSSGSGGDSKDASQKTAATTGTTQTGNVGEEVSVDGGSFTRVSPDELKAMMDSEGLALVNVHIPFQGDIPGTDLSIPYNEVEQNLDRLPAKDERIVVYCRSGSMSAEASRTLVGLGYKNVWDLGGGMIAWQDAGYRLTGI